MNSSSISCRSISSSRTLRTFKALRILRSLGNASPSKTFRVARAPSYCLYIWTNRQLRTNYQRRSRISTIQKTIALALTRRRLHLPISCRWTTRQYLSTQITWAGLWNRSRRPEKTSITLLQYLGCLSFLFRDHQSQRYLPATLELHKPQTLCIEHTPRLVLEWIGLIIRRTAILMRTAISLNPIATVGAWKSDFSLIYRSMIKTILFNGQLY